MKKQLIETKALCCAVLFFFCCLVPLTTGHAQDYVTGSFEGEVKDSVTGDPIPGATVRITNQETGVPIARQTDASGRFRQSQLPPGDYIISVSKQGYAPQSLTKSLTALRPTVLLPPLPLVAESAAIATATPTPDPAVATPTPGAGQPTQPATIPDTISSSEADLRGEINTIDAQRGGTYSRQEVSILPLGSTTLTRTFDELGLLLPGVAPPPQTLGLIAGPGVGAGVGSSGQFAVNGLRSRANNFTVDGSDNNDEDIGVRRQGFLALVPQPIESIQEYQVITLLAPAQYGRNLGAQVNAVSRSGGNETHGTIYGFINASQLNARNPFDYVGPNVTIPLQGRALNADRQTLGEFRNVFVDGVQRFETNRAGAENSFTLGQGGIVLGGPLVPSVDESGSPKSRSLFYFISAEGHLLNASKEESFAVPTVEERGVFRTGATGLFFDPLFPAFPADAFPTTAAGDAVFSFFPFPNNLNGVYGRHTYTTVLPAGGQGKIVSGKLNGNFGAFDMPQEFVARYNFTDDWRDIPVTGGALFSTLRPRVRTQNFSTFLNTNLSGADARNPVLNQFRASYGRTRLIFDEVRDTSFLIPSEFATTLQPDEQRFLLNARTLFNLTLPGDPAVFYFTGGPTERTLNQFPFNPLLAPVGQISVSGYSPIGVDVFNFPQSRVNNTYQVADTVSTQLGSHGVAFGADIRRTELNSELPRNARPLLTFNAFPNFAAALGIGGIPERPFFTGRDLAAAGAPSGAFQALQIGDDSEINLRYYQINFFGQDQWRIRRNLNLSFGLRYEYNTVPKSANNKIERTFGTSLPASISDLRQYIGTRTEIYEADKNNFAPRIGFAYSPDIFKDRITAIRGGAGIFYDQILGSVVSQSRNVYPTFLNTNFAGGLGGDFNIFTPNIAFITCAGGAGNVPLIQPGTLNTLNPVVPLNCFTDVVQATFTSGFPSTLPARTLDTPAAYHYGLTVEQQLTDGLVFSAGYVGTQGRHLLRQTTPNQGPNAIVVITDINPIFTQPDMSGVVIDPIGRGLPNIGGVTLFTANANSRYDALQLQLRGRYSFLGATQFQVNYTYSKATDDVSDVFDLAGAPALPQNSVTFAGERGPANFDVRHRVSSNYVTDLSSWGKKNDFLHAIFNGLEVAGTGTFQTGQPFTVNSIFDINLDGNLTDRLDSTAGITITGDRAAPLSLTGNPLDLLAPLGEDGSVPRNSFRAGNLWVTNAAISKTFRFSETTRLIFRTEVFNLFNRANYGVPVRILEAPGFGRATETITPSRRIQFGLKLAF